MKAYTRGFIKIFWWTQTSLFATGLLLIPGMLELRFEWHAPYRWLMESRVMLAAMHAFAAFAGLLILGALVPIHIRHGLRQRMNLRSGITMLSIVAFLTLSAWAIYYLSGEQLNLWASVLHVGVGIVAAAALTLHVVLARKIQAMAGVACGGEAQRAHADVRDAGASAKG